MLLTGKVGVALGLVVEVDGFVVDGVVVGAVDGDVLGDVLGDVAGVVVEVVVGLTVGEVVGAAVDVEVLHGGQLMVMGPQYIAQGWQLLLMHWPLPQPVSLPCAECVAM